MLPMDYCDVYDYTERPQRAMQLLRMVGLEDHAYDLPSMVSNGQQQAAAIARALANDPPLIVADEPTGNLDSRSADVVIRVFQELAARGKTILIVTHDTGLTSRTDRTIIISDGELIDPTVADVLPSLDHPQMLQATHELQKRTYSPGQTIIKAGDPVEYFYLIANGQVAVADRDAGAPVATLGKGDFFGDVELMLNETAVANVRADGAAVELALIPKSHFYTIMEQSPDTVALIRHTAQERRDENAAREREAHAA
jgi:putative ABC transport system ATP-binding protein